MRASAALLALGLALAQAAAAAPACVVPSGGGIGGTGAPASRDGGIGGTGAPLARSPGGIGGTGAVARVAPGGIGGTGRSAEAPGGGIGGTGIVGTITGFASICVNGLEVHYDEATPTTHNGNPSATRALAVGQVVAVEAGSAAAGLVARRVTIVDPLIGPVTRLDSYTGSIEVMGEGVRLAPQLSSAVLAGLRVGQNVAVSGLRDADGRVVATRIVAAAGAAGNNASVIGLVRPGAVGDVTVTGLPAAARTAGTETLARGEWDGRRLRVRQVGVDAMRPFAGRVERVVVEARLGAGDTRRFRAGGYEVRSDAATRIDDGASRPAGERVVIVSGRPEGRHGLRAERIDADRPESRGGDSPRAAPRQEGGGRLPDAERRQQPVRPERSEAGDKAERATGERSGPIERVERGEKIERAEKAEKIERVEKIERPEKVEKVEKVERPEKIEKVEKVERPEKIEKVEKVERPERVEKIERIDRVEKVERVERPEKIEKIERIERPERVERVEKD